MKKYSHTYQAVVFSSFLEIIFALITFWKNARQLKVSTVWKQTGFFPRAYIRLWRVNIVFFVGSYSANISLLVPTCRIVKALHLKCPTFLSFPAKVAAMLPLRPTLVSRNFWFTSPAWIVMYPRRGLRSLKDELPIR